MVIYQKFLRAKTVVYFTIPRLGGLKSNSEVPQLDGIMQDTYGGADASESIKYTTYRHIREYLFLQKSSLYLEVPESVVIIIVFYFLTKMVPCSSHMRPCYST